MAKPFTCKTIDVTANNPNNTDPARPNAELITWVKRTSGGISVGEAPGATDAPNPKAPDVDKAK